MYIKISMLRKNAFLLLHIMQPRCSIFRSFSNATQSSLDTIIIGPFMSSMLIGRGGMCRFDPDLARLVMGLLDQDPSTRLTAVEALQHPFFAPLGAVLTTAPPTPKPPQAASLCMVPEALKPPSMPSSLVLRGADGPGVCPPSGARSLHSTDQAAPCPGSLQAHVAGRPAADAQLDMVAEQHTAISDAACNADPKQYTLAGCQSRAAFQSAATQKDVPSGAGARLDHAPKCGPQDNPVPGVDRLAASLGASGHTNTSGEIGQRGQLGMAGDVFLTSTAAAAASPWASPAPKPSAMQRPMPQTPCSPCLGGPSWTHSSHPTPFGPSRVPQQTQQHAGVQSPLHPCHNAAAVAHMAFPASECRPAHAMHMLHDNTSPGSDVIDATPLPVSPGERAINDSRTEPDESSPGAVPIANPAYLTSQGPHGPSSAPPQHKLRAAGFASWQHLNRPLGEPALPTRPQDNSQHTTTEMISASACQQAPNSADQFHSVPAADRAQALGASKCATAMQAMSSAGPGHSCSQHHEYPLTHLHADNKGPSAGDLQVALGVQLDRRSLSPAAHRAGSPMLAPASGPPYQVSNRPAQDEPC